MRRALSRPGFVCLALVAALLLAALPAAAQFGPQYQGRGFGKNKVQYRDFDWSIYNSTHFSVYYYPETEPLLQKVVSLAESAYDELSRGFDFQIQDPIPLIFYATHSAFEQNNIILNFIPEGVGAFATPARFRMVLPVDMPDRELYELLLHELTHIFQYHMLFQGSLAKAVATVPPTWFMEGMASYMAKDETARDKMFLRDAVVNDRIPGVGQNFAGFFAYRFGHAVFDFIEERWGKEGFLDFIYEIRNTIGSRADRAIERAFRLEPEEFDQEFRRWLRQKYLPELLETGEPADFGRLFRLEEGVQSQEISPTASPSGDLVAAFSSYLGDVDVVLFDAEKRRFLRNLTKGYTNNYQYLISQELTIARELGRDLAFSPDGNSIAVFAKRERGRSLLLLDVLNGGIRRIIDDMGGIEQQTAPAFSPDGRRVAFSGWKNGQVDIFTIDLESGQIANVTNDAVFDGAPVFSPDGASIAFVSVVGEGHAKIFRVDLANPTQRFQVTTGESNENDPTFSPDGKRLYFTSDRKGPEDIYSLDLATGATEQYTDVVTGTFMPTVLAEPDGKDRLVYTGYWKGRFDLYLAELEEPVEEPTVTQLAGEPTLAENLPAFEPPIDVPIVDSNKEGYGGYRFFLEDAQSFVGVDDDQTFVGRILLSFSDYLGDKRIFADLSSVDSFSNFDILYANLTNRMQWQVNVFDFRSFFIGVDQVTGEIDRGRAVYKVTGAVGSLVYPFSFYQRAELGVGYMFREFLSQDLELTPDGPAFVLNEVQDDFPILQGALVGDSTIFSPWGPIGGRRWRLDASYAPDLDASGTRQSSIDLDVRQYIPVTQRSGFALRGFAGYSEGNEIIPYSIGGLDTLRGFDFREFAGDRAFFANVEYRFPLIDLLATPVVAFQGIRGVLFLDVGGAWFDDFQEFEFFAEDEDRLQDAVSTYGFGVSVRLLGLDLNWDFAQRWDFKESTEDGLRTSFWIGTRF